MSSLLFPGDSNGIFEVSNSKFEPLSSHSQLYIPKLKDFVIGTIIDKNSDSYIVHIDNDNMNTNRGKCILPCLSFDNATKRNKPNLSIGQLIYMHIKY